MIASDSVRYLPSSSSRHRQPAERVHAGQELGCAVLAAHHVDLLDRNVEALLAQVDAHLLRVRGEAEVEELHRWGPSCPADVSAG